MKHVNYRGEFISVAGVCWRVDILLDTPVATVMPLDFDENPLSIEWAEESKEVPICGSTAELNIISPGDRSYTGLYTEDPVGVRMDVYRNGTLYWSGVMDPEFYEEPYSSAKGYGVSLTFSDFGSLDRQRFDLAGRQSLIGLIRMCLDKTGINYTGVNSDLMSGTSEGLSLLDLLVESSNFYDEDKEAMSLHEMLTGILQPLALRIVQRAGAVWVYDLNGLSQAGSTPIEWRSTDQTLGVDKVYNNVRVTWDPYVLSELEVNRKCWNRSSDFTEEEVKMAINSITPVLRPDDAEFYAYHYTQEIDATGSQWIDVTDLGFAMLVSRRGTGAVLTGENSMFYKIIPAIDGEDSEGVALKWVSAGLVTEGGTRTVKLQDHGALPNFFSAESGDGAGKIGDRIVTFDKVDLPAVHNASELRLRIVVNMLMDPRYNPYENAPETGPIASAGSMNNFKSYANFVYVPVMIKYQPNGCDKVYAWTNKDVVAAAPYLGHEPSFTLQNTEGVWVECTGGDVYGYLCWYPTSDPAETSGVTGWKKNNCAVPPYPIKATTELKEYGEGQCIEYPRFGGNTGGKIWIEVYSSMWHMKDYGAVASLTTYPNTYEQAAYNDIDWLLMEVPEISVESSGLYKKELDEEDVEYTGVLNESAREGLEIDTICGTSERPISFARGAYINPYGEQVTQIKRAGRYGQAENLLIGTLYSQFGSRKTKLSGTAAMNGEGVCTYTDEASSGVIMMLAGAVENLREDTVAGTWIEVSPDTYEEGALT